MDKTFKSFREEINRNRGMKTKTGIYLGYESAIKEVMLLLKERKKDTEDFLNLKKLKTKKDFRENIRKHQNIIKNLVYANNIKVKGYENKMEEFIRQAVNRLIGFDILTEAMEDDTITDVFCIDEDTTYIMRNGKEEPYPYQFANKEVYNDFIERIVGLAGKQINKGSDKILDFDLYRDRYAIYSDEVASKGHALSLRKHSESHLERDDLLKQGVFNEDMAELIDLLIDGETNIITGGITGSGKTTTMRALLDYTLGNNKKRTIVCEDTPELFLKNRHTVETKSIKHNDEEIALSLYEIIIAVLRHNPKYIVIGEVRGKEAVPAVEGMETGHSTLFSMHGGTVINVINRLINKYLHELAISVEVAERIIGTAVDYVMMQTNIQGIGRKINMLAEISYDFKERQINIKPIFKFNVKTQEFEQLNKIGEEKANHMMLRGVPYEKLKKWIE